MRERREHGHGKGVDVIERQHREHAVRGLQFMLDADGVRVGREVALREHHALGHAGGAGGVHQQRNGVG